MQDFARPRQADYLCRSELASRAFSRSKARETSSLLQVAVRRRHFCNLMQTCFRAVRCRILRGLARLRTSLCRSELASRAFSRSKARETSSLLQVGVRRRHFCNLMQTCFRTVRCRILCGRVRLSTSLCRSELARELFQDQKLARQARSYRLGVAGGISVI